MNARSIAAVAVPALVAGALLGYFIRPSDSAAPAEKPRPTHENQSAKKETRRPERDADLERLRARVRDLERQLAAASAASEQSVEAPASNRAERVDAPFRHGPPSAAEMRARFEEMREKDPERYTQMTNNMARWRARQQERLQNQFDILASADTTHMTKEQRRVHETYQKLLVRQDELHELINPNNADVTDAQREAAFKEMREIGRQIHDLQRTERDTLLTQTANALGLTGKDAAEVVSAIKAVYEATGQGGHGWHGGPRGPGGGPGGPGRRGR